MSSLGENTSKVANNAVDALRTQPLMLALVLLQMLILGAVLYSTIDRQRAVTKQFDASYRLLEQCMNKERKP